MTTQQIEAIIRVSALEPVEEALKNAGVSGLTISRVRGYGAYRNYFRDDWTHRYARLEIFTSRAREIADLIVDSAHTGQAGDGIVAIEPVDEVIRIKTRDGFQSGED